jgi:hypothetical protein
MLNKRRDFTGKEALTFSPCMSSEWFRYSTLQHHRALDVRPSIPPQCHPRTPISSNMHNAQRILLAVSCLSCFAVLKLLWDSSFNTRLPAQGRVHIGADGRVAYVNAAGADVQHGQKKVASQFELSDPLCADLDGIDDLAIILKTGSTEIYEKLPIHLITTFKCVQDHLVYSDAPQDFAGEPVRDALALVSKEALAELKDLEQHKLLHEHMRLGGDASDLRGDKSRHLDKWKFLPMISDAYFTFGDRKKRYFFVEADTYVSLHNLLPWLSKLDHKESIFAGAQVMIGQTEFGHGGSGVLLSAGAVKAMSTTYRDNQKHWEGIVAEECCGDKVIADVLKAADPPVRLLRSFPMIQGETLSSLDWSETHWCRPAVTWHHVDATGIDKLWQFDHVWRAKYGASKPILFKDYYAAFIQPRLVAANGSLENWDNLSGEPAPAGKKDSVACQSHCEETESCVQWAWRPDSCKVGNVVRLGWALSNRPALGSADDRIEKVSGEALKGAVSGWVTERVEALKEGMGECDMEKMWVTKNDD